MTRLPSYNEATRPPQWQGIVAPYVSVGDYARLCLVDKTSYLHFAPCLWRDPLQTILLLRRNASAGLSWFCRFVLHNARTVRLATRSLVLCLDFRLVSVDLGHDHYWDVDFNFDFTTEGYDKVVGALPSTFPSLRCILLDGFSALDMTWLKNDVTLESSVASLMGSPGPVMLSVRKAPGGLPLAYLSSTYLRDLVYLDLSYLSGSLKHELERSLLHGRLLPRLRILKAQGRDLDDRSALLLLDAFKSQLWSLDLSHNRLTDGFLGHMLDRHLGAGPTLRSLRSGRHYDVEGKQIVEVGGSDDYGRFGFIHESTHSGSFTHPRRHLIDPPTYTSDHHGPIPTGTGCRHDGRQPVRPDSCDRVQQSLLGTTNMLPLTVQDMQDSDVCRGQGGLTHLHLNGNKFSAHQIGRVLRESSGHLEMFDCDSVRLDMPNDSLPPWLSTQATFNGFLGMAHLLRPVLSVNLQLVRIHHSLVTQIPAIQAAGILPAECLWLAETFFGERASMAYPQVFIPDMNPRLCSLTLTDVPRYSNGRLIEKLLDLLQLVSIQERNIQDASVGYSCRSPATVKGLRHLRLEFGKDVREGASGMADFHALDAEKLVSLDSTKFSFFGEAGWTWSRPSNAEPASTPDALTQEDTTGSGPVPPTDTEVPPPYTDRLRSFPFGNTASDHVSHTESWKGEVSTRSVWIGSGIPGPHQAVNEYMRALQNRFLHTNVGPASPCHVLAGVPAASYLFHAAWDAMLVPPWLRRPTPEDLGSMTDTVSAIKQYRAKTRAALKAVQERAGSLDVGLGSPHYHWTGALEISCPTGT